VTVVQLAQRCFVALNQRGNELAALVLAGQAETLMESETADIFRTIAAGVTLLQRRARNPTGLETLILARA
jgi:hypothetical protein